MFIRFNPDAYTDQHGKRVASCWAKNTKGLMTIKPSKKVEWEARIDKLKQEIQNFIDNPPQKIVELSSFFIENKHYSIKIAFSVESPGAVITTCVP